MEKCTKSKRGRQRACRQFPISVTFIVDSALTDYQRRQSLGLPLMVGKLTAVKIERAQNRIPHNVYTCVTVIYYQ